MHSIKLHEATRQFQITNKLAMFFLAKKNMPVKSHSSVISMEQLEFLREFSRKGAEYESVLKEYNEAEKARKKAKKEAEIRKDKPAETDEEKQIIQTTVAREKELEKPAVKPAEKAAIPEPQPEPVKAVRDVKPVIKIEKKPETEVKKAVVEPKKKPEVRKVQKIDLPKPAPKVESRPAPRRAAEKVKPKPAPPAPARTARPDFGKDQRTTVTRTESRPGSPLQPTRPQGQKRTTVSPPSSLRTGRRVRPAQNMRRRRPHNKNGVPRKPMVSTVPPKEETLNLPESIKISDFITLKELSDKLNMKIKTLLSKMEGFGREYQTNQVVIEEDVMAVCKSLGVKVEIEDYEDYLFNSSVQKSKEPPVSRAPIVTVMGHVDHGKTTLLDTMRKTRVADKEAGGITQTIGAYKLNVKGQDIIFIDTPGHEAFTNLRARGAQVTDIVVLIVAANDGVQPQTIEAINHARSAKVPIIVAINKMDMDGADPNRVKQELSRHDLLVEEWGGDVVAVEISAKEATNIDSLLDMILLVAEMQELTVYPKVPGRGIIIESRLDPKLGPLGTLLMLHGKVKRGDYFVCGNATGRIKSFFDDHGTALKQASAPIPVEIMGFDRVPEAGDLFQVVRDVDKAKKVIDIRIQRDKNSKIHESDAGKKLSLHNLFKKMEEGKTKSLPVIVKTDSFGSVEVLEKVLLNKENEKVKVDLVHKGVGNINESDIMLASTSGAIIIGFNVKTPQRILALAKQEKIEIKLYNVIYHLIEDIDKAIKGEIEPEYIETKIGKIEVLQKFKISKLGVVAGCIVREGKVTNKSRLKVVRGKDLVFEGEIETLRRVKDEASEVNAGTECGIKIKNFNAIEIGDFLEAYELTLKQ